MSGRWPGGFITKSPVVPNGETASGVWTLDQAEYYTQAGLWPIPTTYWMSTINSSGVDQDNCESTATDSAGNIYICGYVGNAGYVAKYDPDGALLWQRRLTNATYVYANGVAVGASGNIYVVVSAYTGSGNFTVTMKYDPSGNVLWQQRYGDNTYTFAGQCITLDSSENVYVGGSSTVSYSNYIFVLKYNSSGTLQFQQEVSLYQGFLGAIVLDPSGNIYICGYFNNFGGNYPGYVAKLNSGGNIVWAKQFGTGQPLIIRGLAVNGDASRLFAVGNVPGASAIILGEFATSDGSASGGFNTFAPGTSGTYGRGIKFTSDNNYFYVTGRVGDVGVLLKYNSGGGLLWQTAISSSVAVQTVGITVNSRNVPITTGYIAYNGLDILTMKLRSNGTSAGTFNVGGPNITLAAGSYSTGGTYYSVNPLSITFYSSSRFVTVANLTSSAVAYTANTVTV